MTEMTPGFIQMISVMYWGVIVLCGAYIAIKKGRHPLEGIALAFLMGPLGCIVVACLPVEGRSTKI